MKIHCPTCQRAEDVPDDFRWRPFCSRRCKMIDLGNWLDQVYRIPVEGISSSDDDDEARARQ